MSKFPELSNEEIFDVLLCGGKPRGYGYTTQDYVDEWNDRIANGERFQVDVPPIEIRSDDMQLNVGDSVGGIDKKNKFTN